MGFILFLYQQYFLVSPNCSFTRQTDTDRHPISIFMVPATDIYTKINQFHNRYHFKTIELSCISI